PWSPCCTRCCSGERPDGFRAPAEKALARSSASNAAHSPHASGAGTPAGVRCSLTHVRMRSFRSSSLRPDLDHLDRRIYPRGFPAVALVRRGVHRRRWLRLQVFRYVVFVLAATYFLVPLIAMFEFSTRANDGSRTFDYWKQIFDYKEMIGLPA